ncbi:hypothetical protein [Streptomyces hydrogenans]
MNTVRPTILAAVLAAHGAACGCTGACGTTHTAGACGWAPDQGFQPLHAAPYPPRLTDAANAAVPAAQLRPWCGRCWHRALKARREEAEQQRIQELRNAQIALFDPPAVAAG